MTENITAGTRVRVTGARFVDPLPVTGTVVDVLPDGPTFGDPGDRLAHPFRVSLDVKGVNGAARQTDGTETIYAYEVEPVEHPERPTIDFGTDSRATAREYAVAANSRILDTAHQSTLKRVAAGDVVDALDLNAALTQAMSSAATRVGQSMGRRDLTKKIRHLAYIVQAVLENHVDGLPTYEPGARSRKIEELSRENSHASEVNQSLTRQLTAAREMVKAQQDRARRAEGRLEVAQEREGLLNKALAARDEDAETGENTIAGLTASLEYALGLLATLDNAAANQALGFMDAWGVEIEEVA